ncbi:hypothetical protein D3C80_435240 [compost metagenome]
MSLVAIVAKELMMNEHLNGKWPSLVDEDGDVLVASKVTQYGNHTLQFDEPVWPYQHYRTKEIDYVEEVEDVDGLPWLESPSGWGGTEGDTVTREEYEAFVQRVVGGDYSKLEEYFANGEREALKQIAQLNVEVGELVNKIVDIAEPFGIDVSINLGYRGSLDLNGPWDSSSAYC